MLDHERERSEREEAILETILIVCGAGASSTFLASRMRSLAKSRGLDLVVKAASDSDIDSWLDRIDGLLVGPHLAPGFHSLSARAAQFDVPAVLLPENIFGPGGAEEALESATALIHASGGNQRA